MGHGPVSSEQRQCPPVTVPEPGELQDSARWTRPPAGLDERRGLSLSCLQWPCPQAWAVCLQPALTGSQLRTAGPRAALPPGALIPEPPAPAPQPWRPRGHLPPLGGVDGAPAWSPRSENRVPRCLVGVSLFCWRGTFGPCRFVLDGSRAPFNLTFTEVQRVRVGVQCTGHPPASRLHPRPLPRRCSPPTT